jgi:hypothetical protein
MDNSINLDWACPPAVEREVREAKNGGRSWLLPGLQTQGRLQVLGNSDRRKLRGIDMCTVTGYNRSMDRKRVPHESLRTNELIII